MAEAYRGGVVFVAEGQLVGSKDQRRESVANPLVASCAKVLPGCVQNLKEKDAQTVCTHTHTHTLLHTMSRTIVLYYLQG